MNILDVLGNLAADAFAACGYDRELGKVTVSNRPDLCQFQCNGAMAAAKQYKKNPAQIAEEVAAKLAGGMFAKVEVVKPGFINIDLADTFLADTMNEMLADERLLLPVMDEKTIVVDFGGPNIAKPLHVGHLRSAIIGDSLCRLARFLGHRVIGDTHLGDWGLQIGMVIAETQRRMPDLPYFDPDFAGEYPAEAPFTVDDLSDIYPAASARSKTDEDFAQKAALATVELQNGRPGYIALWKQIRAVSVTDLKRSYDILGVHFDEWLGESDAAPYVPRVIDALQDKGLLYESDGAQVVDVALPEDKEPMPPILIVKSDGGEIYGTTDLGTILQRVEDWKPNEMWYVVDNRQALHFKQVFRCARLAGFLGETQCFHVGFGTMNGKDGKPYKTRDGGVMRLSDMIDAVTQNAYDMADSSNISMDEAGKKATAQTVGVAAMKIGDMVNHRTKDYIFDMERFLASDGKTGPYLQYAAVRIASVLQRAKDAGLAPGPILPPASRTEQELMLSFLNVPERLLRTFNEKAPNVICESLFDIAGLFNRFYAENKILVQQNEAQRASWLSLLELTRRYLVTQLSLLGIGIPQSM